MASLQLEPERGCSTTKPGGVREEHMKKADEKWTLDAANYFKEEILDIWPDVPKEELSEMVGEYIYYQQPDVTKTEATHVVEEACVK